jgi:hypothetical protein
MLSPTSRYQGIETAAVELPDGREVTYLRRRFIPSAERFSLLQEHTVAEGERLDHIAARYLGDPEQYHLLCDANNALHPLELTETPGRVLRITLPAGLTTPEVP